MRRSHRSGGARLRGFKRGSSFGEVLRAERCNYATKWLSTSCPTVGITVGLKRRLADAWPSRKSARGVWSAVSKRMSTLSSNEATSPDFPMPRPTETIGLFDLPTHDGNTAHTKTTGIPKEPSCRVTR